MIDNEHYIIAMVVMNKDICRLVVACILWRSHIQTSLTLWDEHDENNNNNN